MKHLLIALVSIILLANLFIPLSARKSPDIDKIEQMLRNVEKNLVMAQSVTQQANKTGEKMLNTKVAEKKALKEQVIQLKEQNTLLSQKVINAGLDTMPDDVFEYSGPLWDEYQLYIKNGGTSDFEYYRLYRK